MTRTLVARAAARLAALALAAAGASHAAEREAPLRDPLQPPAAAQASAPRSAGAEAPVAASNVLRQILVVDGKRYVVEGVRRRGIGDLLGSARIERIEDDAVWVRAGGALQRLPMYGNVVKKLAVESAPPALAASAAGTRADTLARASTSPPKR